MLLPRSSVFLCPGLESLETNETPREAGRLGKIVVISWVGSDISVHWFHPQSKQNKCLLKEILMHSVSPLSKHLNKVDVVSSS